MTIGRKSFYIIIIIIIIIAADGGCESHVVHRMNEGYRAWGALKSVLSNRGLGIKAKKCLLLLLKKVGSARLRESEIHPISPKTPAPQYQHIDRNKRKGKREEDNSRDSAAYANKETLALLLKPASPTPSNTGLAISFQRDTEKGIKVLLYCKVLQRGGA